MNPDTLTLFHNRSCSTSRKALGLLEASGLPFVVVDYVSAGWSGAQLRALAAALGGAHALLRSRHPDTAGLTPASEEAVFEAMTRDPLLVERPIVWGPSGAVLARPIERLSQFLEQDRLGPRPTP